MKNDHPFRLSLPECSLALPALADDAHHPEQPGEAKPVQAQPTARPKRRCRTTWAECARSSNALAKAKTAEERGARADEHMQTMQENMAWPGACTAHISSNDAGAWHDGRR